MNAFDFDGVISIGVYPGPDDIIITGRSFDEAHIVNRILFERGIFNSVFYNPVTTEYRGTGTELARRCSGRHKAETLYKLKQTGIDIQIFFEDDEVQIEEIISCHPNIKIAHLVHDLVEK